MSNLSLHDRAELPDTSFGDPTDRLFPILDQDDVDSAARLIGQARHPDQVKARIITLAHKAGLRVPAAWQ